MEFDAQDTPAERAGRVRLDRLRLHRRADALLRRPARQRPTGPSRSSYFGIVDLAGFPKDRYYLYQSQWTAKPMVHVLPHWNWAGLEGKTIPVMVYTNADEVELFLNGKSLGRKKRGVRTGGDAGGPERRPRPEVHTRNTA